MPSPASAEPFLELPRVHIDELTYKRFLSDFALPRVPFILVGVGGDWPAAKRWHALDYFLNHPGVALDYPVTVSVGEDDEHETTVGEALRMLRDRVAEAAAAPEVPIGGRADAAVYINAWDFVRGSSSALQEDFSVPSHFDRAPKWLAEHVVFGNAAVDLRWLYIGERGTGSPTHLDPNLSSAWLWVAHGEKSWICAHGDDRALITAAAAAAGGGGGGEEEDAVAAGYDGDPLPDLFAANLFERHPSLRGARLYRGTQRAGEIVFNPSCCVHAVRNVSPLVVSCTRNFIDATNIADAVGDATRSFHADLLPMVGMLGQNKVIQTLGRTLHLKRSRVASVLAALPGLFSAERLNSLVEAAARGASDEEREEVRGLVRRHLEEALEREQPAFEAAAKELCQQLGLVPNDESV